MESWALSSCPQGIQNILGHWIPCGNDDFLFNDDVIVLCIFSLQTCLLFNFNKATELFYKIVNRNK